MEAQLERLKTEHNKSLGLIAALRQQIKETKDAVEFDDPKLQTIKAKVQTETADRQKQLEAHIKLKMSATSPNKAKVSRAKLGAAAEPLKGGALPVAAASDGKAGLEFGAMDGDGDGVLSKEELQEKLHNMGWSLEEAEKTFNAIDRDGTDSQKDPLYRVLCTKCTKSEFVY